jgi:hypothetical protein
MYRKRAFEDAGQKKIKALSHTTIDLKTQLQLGKKLYGNEKENFERNLKIVRNELYFVFSNLSKQ